MPEPPREPKQRPQSPTGARRSVDPWEAVVREELRRLRRRPPAGRRLADIPSRSARGQEDPGAPPPAE
jgi:hypothetical protein